MISYKSYEKSIVRNKGKVEGKNRQENISEEMDIKTTEKIRRRKRERKDCQFVRNSSFLI